MSPTHIPFVTRPLGKSSFHLTTTTGRSLQTYDLRSGLRLVFVSRPQTPGPITAIASWGEKVLAAWSQPESAPSVWVFNRGRKIGELQVPATDQIEDIHDLVVFGSWIVCCCVTQIHVWKSDSLEYYTTLMSPLAGSDDACLTGGITTMPTFANKIFAGRADGSIEIWNVSTGRLLHRILPPSGKHASAVSALEPTPALSLIAIAYASGLVAIHDVVADRTLMRLHAGGSTNAPVTSISFRTDDMGAGSDGQQAGVMATASHGDGDVHFWDLNNGGKRLSTLRGAHSTQRGANGLPQGMSKISFLSGQSVLVTSGADNALRTWTFDEGSTVPRLLHSRSGHAGPITSLNFLPGDAEGADFTGKWLLSTGKDSAVWAWSLRKDSQSTELSQGAVQKRKRPGQSSNVDQRKRQGNSRAIPAATCLACCLNRDGGMGAGAGNKTVWAKPDQLRGKSTETDQYLTGWESIVTGHAGEKHARTWYWGRKRAGRWLLETVDKGEVRSVAISPCGTFALVGTDKGGIDMFNLQSGQHRQHFPPKITREQAKRLKAEPSDERRRDDNDDDKPLARGLGKHHGPVTGVDVDSLNNYVLSCGSDGRFKFWDFQKGGLLHQIDLSQHGSINGLRLHRASNLCALSCGDDCIRIIDIDTRRIVRELRTPHSQIRDWCFSSDGRWIVACTADSVLRIWDLPTGHLIDAMRLARPCTAIAFSHTGEFFVTAQEDSCGIDVWTNRALFGHVSTLPLSEPSIAAIEAPAVSGENGLHLLAPALEDDTEKSEEDAYDGTLLPAVDQLSRDVETLSLVPRANWQNLLHLDLIRDRNKPIEPPKAPERAPFFLPSLEGAPPVENGVDSSAADRALSSRILGTRTPATQSRFSTLLAQTSDSETEGLAGFVAHLKALPPSQAETEIRSLDTQPPYDELVWFVQALTARLTQRQDYELLQTWIAVFMNCHGSFIADAADGDEQATRLVDALRRWRDVQRKEADRLSHLAGYCAGVLNYLRSSR